MSEERYLEVDGIIWKYDGFGLYDMNDKGYGEAWSAKLPNGVTFGIDGDAAFWMVFLQIEDDADLCVERNFRERDEAMRYCSRLCGTLGKTFREYA